MPGAFDVEDPGQQDSEKATAQRDQACQHQRRWHFARLPGAKTPTTGARKRSNALPQSRPSGSPTHPPMSRQDRQHHQRDRHHRRRFVDDDAAFSGFDARLAVESHEDQPEHIEEVIAAVMMPSIHSPKCPEL